MINQNILMARDKRNNGGQEKMKTVVMPSRPPSVTLVLSGGVNSSRLFVISRRKMPNNLSALVCVKNSAETLGKCLQSLLDNNISEIIVIDGDSTDESWKIAEKFTNRVYSDSGKGLGFARKLGVSKVNSEFLIILGPDDLLSKNALEESIVRITQDEKIAGILAHKRLEICRNFWERGQDGLYELFSAQPVRVIGNPSLYRVKLLRDFEFDEFFSANEDTDLCERWWDNGYSVCRGPLSFQVFETTHQNLRLTYQRYTWYGRGDFDFVIKWIRMKPRIAIRHLFHPLRNYMIIQPVKLMSKGKVESAIFSILAGLFRYIGFLQRVTVQKK